MPTADSLPRYWLLFVLSAPAIALSDQILDHVLVVPPVPQDQLCPFGDESEGGNSEARLISAEQRHAQCVLLAHLCLPVLWLRGEADARAAQGPGPAQLPHAAPRAALHRPVQDHPRAGAQCHRRLPKLGERESLKFNEIEFGVDQLRNHMVDILLNALSVPPWGSSGATCRRPTARQSSTTWCRSASTAARWTRWARTTLHRQDRDHLPAHLQGDLLPGHPGPVAGGGRLADGALVLGRCARR